MESTISMCHCVDNSVVLNMPFEDLLLSQHMHFFFCSLPLAGSLVPICRCTSDHHSTYYVMHMLSTARWLDS